jgi:hypothetical protein
MLGGLLGWAGLVVDALLGTGFSGEVREREAARRGRTATPSAASSRAHGSPPTSTPPAP